MQWLRIANGREKVPSPLRGTGKWLLKHERFKRWLESPTDSVLWLSGVAGSGKSVLASSMVQQLVEKSEGSLRTAVIACHFFHYENARREPLKNVFRSLLYQVLSQSPQIMFGSGHRERQQSLLYPCLQPKAEREEEMPSEVWGNLFQASVLEASSLSCVYIVVDALDECEDAASYRVLSSLSALASTQGKQPIRIFISSRPSASHELFSNSCVQTIHLEKENSKDLKYFVHTEIRRRLPHLAHNPTVPEEIARRARGVFLWVTLVVRTLLHRDNTDTSLELQLSMLPNNLNSLYNAMLQRIVSNGRASERMALRIFMWVSCSVRPLTIEELRAALSIDPCLDSAFGSVSGVVPSVAVTEPSKPDDARLALELCSELFLLDECNLQFVHHTAREFLEECCWKLSGRRSKSINYFDIHGYIAVSCLTYLASHSSTNSRVPGSAFLGYATAFWVEHARAADSVSPSNVDLSPILQVFSNYSTSPRFKVTIPPSEYDKTSGQIGWNLLHACAAYGLHRFTSAILSSQNPVIGSVDDRDLRGRTPLFMAVQYGHMEIVELLLEKGADVLSRETQYGVTALHWACSYYLRAACSNLNKVGADITDQFAASTPSRIVAPSRYNDIVRLLLESGADPDIVDANFGRSPLHYAAANGDLSIVLELLNHGADINFEDQHTKHTALHHAVYFHHVDIVRFLLDNGAALDNHDPERSEKTPLTWVDRVVFGLSRRLSDSVDHCLQYPTTHGETSQGGSGDTKTGKHSTNQKSEAKSSKRSAEDGTPSGKGNGSNDNSGERPNKRPALNNAPASSKKAPHLHLACPYFKHSPEKFAQKKRCCGPNGWPDVHRLKYVLLLLQQASMWLSIDRNIENISTKPMLFIIVLDVGKPSSL